MTTRFMDFFSPKPASPVASLANTLSKICKKNGQWSLYKAFGLKPKDPNCNGATLQHNFKELLKKHRSKLIDTEEYQLGLLAYHTLTDFELKKDYDAHDGVWKKSETEDPMTDPAFVASFENFHAIEAIIKQKNMDVNSRNMKKQTPLYTAARSGCVQICEWLLNNGADPNVQQVNGSTALHAAAYYDQPKVVRLLIEHGAKTKILNASKHTPVDEAATTEITKVFEELADNVWVRTNDGDLEFLQKYADPEKLQYFMNSRGETLLMIAARHGYVDLMKFFIKNNANIDARSFHLQTPLHFAVHYKHTKAIELLLEVGANQDSIDVNGCSAFNLAQKNGGKEVILPFLEHSQRDSYEEAKKGNFKWFETYVGFWKQNSVADVNTPDKYGRTILHYAAIHGHIKLTRKLLKERAHVDPDDDLGNTPLHYACQNGDFEMIELLLEHRADQTVKNKSNKTPMDEASCSTMEKNTSFSKEKSQSIVKNIFEKYQFSDETLMVQIVYQKNATETIWTNLFVNMETQIGDLQEMLKKTHIHPNIENIKYWLGICGREIILDSPTVLLFHSIANCLPIQYCHFVKDRIHIQFFIEQPKFLFLPTKKQIPDAEKLSEPVIQQVKCMANTSLTVKTSRGGVELFFQENSFEKDTEIEIYEYPEENIERSYRGVRGVSLFRISYSEKIKNPIKCDFSSGHCYSWNQKLGIWISVHRTQGKCWVGKGLFCIIAPRVISPFVKIVGEGASGVEDLKDDKFPKGSKIVKFYIDKNLDEFNWEVGFIPIKLHAINSLLTSGFLAPGFLTVDGHLIRKSKRHGGLMQENLFEIPNFANAVFFTPFLDYALHPQNDINLEELAPTQYYVPVLQCFLKKSALKLFPSTIKAYCLHSPGDRPEQRVTDTCDIFIGSLIFVPSSSYLEENTHNDVVISRSQT